MYSLQVWKGRQTPNFTCTSLCRDLKWLFRGMESVLVLAMLIRDSSSMNDFRSVLVGLSEILFYCAESCVYEGLMSMFNAHVNVNK